MATTDVEVLQVNTNTSQKSIADLKREIKELKGELLSLNEGTAEYNQKLVEVADKTHQLDEVTRQVKATSTDFGDRLSNVQGTIGGLSGAFQTVLGSLSLMGVEMGDDVKMLKMLQSAMAITQGIAAIDTGVKAFKALTISIKASTVAMSGLQKALITTGIGAAAVAVGVLVTKLSELKRSQDEAREAAEKHNEALREQLKISNQITKAESDYYNKQYKQVPVINALEEKLAANRAYWQEEFRKGNINNLELNKRIEDERLKYVTNAGNTMRDRWTTILSHNTDAEWKASEEGKKIWNEYFNARAIAAYGDLNEQKAVMVEWEKYTEETAKRTQKTVQTTVKDVDDVIKTQSSLTMTEGNITNPDQARLEEKNKQAELEALTEYYNTRADIIISNEANVDEQLLQLDMDYRDKREELLRQRFADGLIAQDEFNNELAQLEVEAAELQIEQEKRLTDKTKEELEKRKKMYDGYVSAIKSVTSSIISILGSLASNMEEGTKEWKNIKIAEALIETISGSLTAYFTTMKSVGGGWVGIAAGAAAAAATFTAGMMEIQKIRNTKIGGSNSSTSSGMSSVNASAVSVNATSVTATRPIQTEDDIANLPDTRVYVTEEDITRAQNRVRVTLQNATY